MQLNFLVGGAGKLGDFGLAYQFLHSLRLQPKCSVKLLVAFPWPVGRKHYIKLLHFVEM